MGPDRFTPGKQTRYPLYRRLGVRQVRSGRGRKISPPPEFDSLIVQRAASRHSDNAVTGRKIKTIFNSNKFIIGQFYPQMLGVRSLFDCSFFFLPLPLCVLCTVDYLWLWFSCFLSVLHNRD